MRFLIILLMLTLNACQNQQGLQHPEHQAFAKQYSAPQSETFPKRYGSKDKDGAPTGALPVFFQKVKPKDEPLSRYGNPDSYAVAGHNYTVLQSASGYKARGLASWYGTKFQRQRTSSGEHYDMYAMTAAHRTLPLPSYLRVKNLDNGREAIVKVNDRGPFHSGRVIDLSYAAATKLGMLPKGTARVEIEALTVNSRGKQRIAHYYVQAGAFSSNKIAHVLRTKLAKLTASPVFIEKNQGRYLVKVGPYAQKSMVIALQKQLQKNGVRGSFSMML